MADNTSTAAAAETSSSPINKPMANGFPSSSSQSIRLHGPDFTSPDLSFLDVYLPGLYSYRILFFRTSDDIAARERLFSALRSGLQNLLEVCPLLGGTVEPVPDDVCKAQGLQRGWKAIKPSSEGLELVVKDLSERVPSFDEMERRQFPCSVLPVADTIPVDVDCIMDGPYTCAKFQLSYIKGGAMLAVCIVHAVCDGNGMDQCIGLLADECRLADVAATQPGKEEVLSDARREAKHGKPKGFDRNPVIRLNGTPTTIEEHPGYILLPDPAESMGGGPPESPSLPESHMYMLQFSAANLAALKEAAKPTFPGAPSFITTHDALEAFIWRSLMLARSSTGIISNDPTSKVNFSMTTNARKLLDPPLDRLSYMGNCVYFINATLPLSNLLSTTDGLAHGAAAIRTALNKRTQAGVASVQNLAKSLPDVRMLFWSGVPNCATDCATSGSAWRSTFNYGGKWGEAFGPVVRMRSPDTGFFARFTDVVHTLPMIPSGAGNGETEGGAEMQVWYTKDGLAALKKDEVFGKYAKIIDGPEGTVDV